MFNTPVFTSTINLLLFLFILIAVGFCLQKFKLIPDNSAAVLSKVETTLFLPAVLLKTFMDNFTIEKMSSSWQLILFSVIAEIVIIPLGLFIGWAFSRKDDYVKKVFQYSFLYSNFTFLGIPLVEALNPDLKLEYLIFTIVPQIIFSVWALPYLLIPKKEDAPASKKNGFLVVLKRVLNPVLIGLIIGAILGLTGLGPKMPKFISDAIGGAGNCMSIVAMLLTGMVIAKYDMLKIIKDYRIYVSSIVRLVVIPCICGLLMKLLLNAGIIDNTMVICLMIFVSMPFGLNTVIIPAGFGKDTSIGAGMALVSHIIGLITVPIILYLFITL